VDGGSGERIDFEIMKRIACGLIMLMLMSAGSARATQVGAESVPNVGAEQKPSPKKRDTKLRTVKANDPIVARTIAAKKISREAMPPPALKAAGLQSTPTRLFDPALITPMGASPRASTSVVVAPPQLQAHVWRNLSESYAPPPIEMGDRPARGTSLCGDGKLRRFGEIDSKALAGLLPDFNVVRPRTVCARRGAVIADYMFK
jgi:hypothetical protein